MTKDKSIAWLQKELRVRPQNPFQIWFWILSVLSCAGLLLLCAFLIPTQFNAVTVAVYCLGISACGFVRSVHMARLYTCLHILLHEESVSWDR